MLKNVKSKPNFKLLLNMKKFLILSVSLLLTVNIFSQVNVGLRSGMNFSNMTMITDGVTDEDAVFRPGYNVGVVVNYAFTDMFYLESGITLESRGYEYRVASIGDYWENGAVGTKLDAPVFGNNANYGRYKTNLTYFDFPLYAKLRYNLGNMRLYGQAGPYVGFAIKGRTKTTKDLEDDLRLMGDPYDIDWLIGDEDDEDYPDDLRICDYGLSAGFGVEFYNIEVGIYFDYGLRNLEPLSDGDLIMFSDRNNSIRNRSLKLSVAYIFGYDRED